MNNLENFPLSVFFKIVLGYEKLGILSSSLEKNAEGCNFYFKFNIKN
jgi:hypothetical protein